MNTRQVMPFFWRSLLSAGAQFQHNIHMIATTGLVAFILFCIYKLFKKQKEYAFLILLILLWVFAIFSVNFVLGVYALPTRAMLAIAFYQAFIFLLIIIFSKYKLLKYVIVLVSIIVLFFDSYHIVRYQVSYKMTYDRDKTIGYDLINKIYDKYPEIYDGKYTIVFVGMLPVNNTHPLIQKEDVFGNGSFFNWDSGNQFRMLHFFYTLGFPTTIKLGNITDDMTEFINKMPKYPNKDCVGLYKETVIIKLR